MHGSIMSHSSDMFPPAHIFLARLTLYAASFQQVYTDLASAISWTARQGLGIDLLPIVHRPSIVLIDVRRRKSYFHELKEDICRRNLTAV